MDMRVAYVRLEDACAEATTTHDKCCTQMNLQPEQTTCGTCARNIKHATNDRAQGARHDV
eukprot:9217593-Alexandrium_andersonii.AAC.1